jgi:hypothetical protein
MGIFGGGVACVCLYVHVSTTYALCGVLRRVINIVTINDMTGQQGIQANAVLFEDAVEEIIYQQSLLV